MTRNDNRMLGVGCFAGPPTLARVLDRMMEAYSLGDWREAIGGVGRKSTECPALRELIDPGHVLDERDGGKDQEEKIAGFFLGFENQQLRLSVFTRRRGSRCRKYTASLEELKRLRQSRLH